MPPVTRIVTRGLVTAVVGVGVAGAGVTTAGAAPATPAAGTFTATIIGFKPPQARGANCLVTVDGVLTFEEGGTLVGAATGTTTALVHASCDEVRSSPLGAFSDAFTFRGTFVGTINGQPVEDELVYAGASRPPGDITATIRIGRAATAVLRADAQVGVGGTYTGIARA
jgi:hypothetical protein